MLGGDCFASLAMSASIGTRPPLDWQERLAEETPDIVMKGFRPPTPALLRIVKDVDAIDKRS